MARGVVLGLILLGEFGILEAGLRVFGTMESQSAFQSLFIPDARIGYRLRPGISVRYSTPEFSNDLTINGQGVRDEDDIGPKAPNERRVLVLGDSYVFAVQVPLSDTLGEQLEVRLNESDPVHRWRVINGGVQGYGPVEEWLFYRHVASRFDPDIVLIVVSVANDAIEAFDAKAKLELGRVPEQTLLQRGRTQLRQIIRLSLVLQLVRLRADQLRARTFTGTFERPLVGYLERPPSFFFDGLQTAERAFGYMTAHARKNGAKAALVLMPARFQIRDAEYRTLSNAAEEAGNKLMRNAATERFATALARLDEPTLDLLPIFSSVEDPEALYFVGNSHLTARGHRVVAEALRDFLSRDRLAATTARE
jgi:lysophospholipase L1-like esterase